jgi:hypothetical protein
MNRDAVVIKKTPVAGAEINKPVAACLAKEKGNGKDGDGNKGQVQEDEEVKRKRKEEVKKRENEERKRKEEIKRKEEENERWWAKDQAPCCGKGCRCVLMVSF